MFKDRCKSYPEKCQTCVNNQVGDYYVPKRVYPKNPWMVQAISMR